MEIVYLSRECFVPPSKEYYKQMLLAASKIGGIFPSNFYENDKEHKIED